MQQPSNGQTIVLQTPLKTIYAINEKVVFRISTTIIILGIICVILQLAGSVIGIGLREAGAGIWCGAWFVLSGSFGISAAQQKTKQKIVTFLVLSIISVSVFSGALVSAASVGLIIDVVDYEDYCDDNGYYEESDRSCFTIEAGVALNSVMILLSAVIGILSILGSAFSCSAYCCRKSNQVTSETVPCVTPYPRH